MWLILTKSARLGTHSVRIVVGLRGSFTEVELVGQLRHRFHLRRCWSRRNFLFPFLALQQKIGHFHRFIICTSILGEKGKCYGPAILCFSVSLFCEEKTCSSCMQNTNWTEITGSGVSFISLICTKKNTTEHLWVSFICANVVALQAVKFGKNKTQNEAFAIFPTFFVCFR